MESLNINRTLLAVADAAATQIEKDKNGAFLLVVKTEDGQKVRNCSSVIDLSCFIGASISTLASNLRNIGIPDKDIKTIIDGIVTEGLNAKGDKEK